MINAKEFVNKWTNEGGVLVFPPTEEIQNLKVPDLTKDWLIEAGLPAEAAPFLSFGKRTMKSWFPYVSELYHLGSQYSALRVVGFNGSGDPICIDESASGMVVCLNHDIDFKKIFMNYSVPKLAGCLLAYMDEQDADRFRSAVRKIDPDALREDTFWWYEANCLEEKI